MSRLIVLILVVISAACFAQSALATTNFDLPPNTHVWGSGRTVWGVWHEGWQKFDLHLFTKANGKPDGYMVWTGAAATNSATGPLVHYHYAGHPLCLAGYDDTFVGAVLNPFPTQVFTEQGALEIVQNAGSHQNAWGVLIATDETRAQASTVCADILKDVVGLGDFPFGPLPVLDGHVHLLDLPTS